MIRTLNIGRHLFNILRPQYALNYVTLQLNKLYRFLFACLYPLVGPCKEYETMNQKYLRLASNDGSSVSVAYYLNYYYGKYGRIFFGAPEETGTAMFTYGDGDPVIISTEDTGNFFGMYSYGDSSTVKLQPSTIFVPEALEQDTELYPDFTADINALLILGVKANVITY